jgi:hypothetical protein
MTFDDYANVCPYCQKDLNEDVCEHWVATLCDDGDGFDTQTPLYFGWIERCDGIQERMVVSFDRYFRALCVLCEQVAKKGPDERKRVLREARRLPLEEVTLTEAIKVVGLLDAKDNYETTDDLLRGEFGRQMKDVFTDFFGHWSGKCSKIDWTIASGPGLSWGGTSYCARDANGCVMNITYRCEQATRRIKILTNEHRVPSHITQFEKLCMIPSEQGRIDAVAADLKSKRRRFGKIDPSDLEEAFSIQLDGPDCSHMTAISQCSLDDRCDEFPAWNHLELLRGRIAERRYKELKAQGQEIADGRRTKDITLRPRERRLMEEAIAKDDMANGGGWQINRHALRATDGTDVCFQVNQGDGGELFDLVGPYEIHDKGWPTPKGIVIGERW